MWNLSYFLREDFKNLCIFGLIIQGRTGKYRLYSDVTVVVITQIFSTLILLLMQNTDVLLYIISSLSL